MQYGIMSWHLVQSNNTLPVSIIFLHGVKMTVSKHTYTCTYTCTWHRLSKKSQCIKVRRYGYSWTHLKAMRGVTGCRGSHSTTCHPTQVNIPPLSQPHRLVLD